MSCNTDNDTDNSNSGSTLGISQDLINFPSDAIFTITPANAEAKIEFSGVVDWLQEQKQDHSNERSLQSHVKKYMHISKEPVLDGGVARVIQWRQNGTMSSSPLSSQGQTSNSQGQGSIVSVPSSAAQGQILASPIWTGYYYLDLQQPPRNPSRGWTAGRFGQKNGNDLVLSMSNHPSIQVRQNQALFQVSDVGRVLIRSLTREPSFVNGEPLSRGDSFYLHHAASVLTLGCLKYHIAYGPFCQSRRYRERAAVYLNQHLNTDPSALWALVETPREEPCIQIGEWHLTNAGTVGSGASGRVSIGINRSGQTVALKRFAVDGDRSRILLQRQKLEKITMLARQASETRILCLRGVLDDNPAGNNPAVDIWFVLEPAIPETLLQTVNRWLIMDKPTRLERTRHVMSEVLRALDFLHSSGWLHGDIKPQNIGVLNPHASQVRIVLLDMDEVYPMLAPGQTYRGKPGHTGGTVGWLSPEREMVGFDESCDLWSVGVLALFLVNGKHPWGISVNPWRPEPAFEDVRLRFHTLYWNAVNQVQTWDDRAFANAVLGTVRHPYANHARQGQKRLTAGEALALLCPRNQSREQKRIRT